MPGSRITLESGSYSLQGRRDYQQDRVAAGKDYLVVCDGMGGHANGDKASQAAMEVILSKHRRVHPHALFGAAREAVSAKGGGSAGTTATLIQVIPGESAVRLSAAGDSPAWIYSPSHGRMRRLFSPHRDKRGYLKKGLVGSKSEGLWVPEISSFLVSPHDLILVGSDGLEDGDANERLVREVVTMSAAEPAATIARRLVWAAYRNGSTDNISAAVARVKDVAGRR